MSDRRFHMPPLTWLNNRVSGLLAGVSVALRSLWENKLRACLTALGIIIGVMTVVGILSVIHGLNTSVENQLSFLGSRSLYVDVMPWVVRGHWRRFRNRPPITNWQFRRLKEINHLADALVPIERRMAQVSRKGQTVEGISLEGTNADYLSIVGFQIGQGRFFAPADVSLQRPYAVVGAQLAKELFSKEQAVGKFLFIQGMRFQVIGVLEAQGGGMISSSTDMSAIVPIGRFRRLMGHRHSMVIGVKVREGLDLDRAAEDLRGLMRRVRALRPLEKDNFAVNQQSMITKLYRDSTWKLYVVITIVSFISLVIGGISIMNIMLVSVTERTREIGIRKALGARKRAILFQFLLESLTLSALGGLIGVGLGFGVAHVVQVLSPLPAKASVFAVMVGLGFSSLVGIGFGMYPAWRASRLDPIEALRFE